MSPQNPTPEPPEITRVQSDNEPDGTVNIGGAFLEVSGQNILDATEVKLNPVRVCPNTAPTFKLSNSQTFKLSNPG